MQKGIRAWFGVLMVLGFAHVSHAVTSAEQAERLQLIHSHVLDFRWESAPVRAEESSWNFAGELLWQPTVDHKVGTKSEPVDAPPAIPRPRVQFLSKNGWFVGGSWLPPVEVQKFQANVFGLEGGYIHQVEGFHLGARLAVVSGSLKGPITDPNEKDTFTVENTDLDVALSYPIQSWIPFVGLGAGSLSSTLKIAADGVELEVNSHPYGYAFLGLSYQWTPSLRVTFQQHQTEEFLGHWLAGVSYHWFQ